MRCYNGVLVHSNTSSPYHWQLGWCLSWCFQGQSGNKRRTPADGECRNATPIQIHEPLSPLTVRRYQPRRERWTSAIGSSPVRLALPPSLVRTPTVSLLALQHNLPWSPDRRVSFPTSLRLATNSSSLASPVA